MISILPVSSTSTVSVLLCVRRLLPGSAGPSIWLKASLRIVYEAPSSGGTARNPFTPTSWTVTVTVLPKRAWVAFSGRLLVTFAPVASTPCVVTSTLASRSSPLRITSPSAPVQAHTVTSCSSVGPRPMVKSPSGPVTGSRTSISQDRLPVSSVTRELHDPSERKAR